MRTSRITILAFSLSIFLTGTAEDYYWVGGQGDWSDLNKWRTSNGQIPNEVPDANDNVIFNQNSFLQPFDTVFIQTGNPTCKDMTWINLVDTVVLFGGSDITNFTIYGSIRLHSKLKNRYFGKITLSSDQPGNTITCDHSKFSGDLRFDGNGEWILQDTLFVYDSTSWKALIFDYVDDPFDPNPLILHFNGKLNTNGQVIISRGFATTGNKQREILMDNTHFYMLGNWVLSAENLTFSAANSYIFIGGEMSNLNGDEVHYHDIDFKGWIGGGSIKNSDIRSVHRKVHFLGSGTVDGKKTPGTEGMFTCDTLLFDGEFSMVGPIPCDVKGPWFDIHYTRIEMVDGHFSCNTSDFHRIDYNGWYPSDFYGRDCVIDSLHFFYPEGRFFGYNTVNHLLFYKTFGSISSDLGMENTVNHAVFSGDGIFEGNNTIDWLTLNTGYWYQMQVDSLIHPGSYNTNTYIQTIHQLEVVGNCNKGLSILTSEKKDRQALINYTGGAPLSTEYLQVKDIKNLGSALQITHGIDAGNNINIQFSNSLQPRTLYWVGSQGDWDNSNNWSLTSGGPGGECPPTLLDDIFFDGGSGFSPDGDTVLINVKHAQFNDMTWENTIQNHAYLLSGDTVMDTMWNEITLQTDTVYFINANDSVNLHIWGSIKLDTVMSFLHFGNVYFESEEDDDYESIDVHWKYETDDYWHFFGQTHFNGRGGKWRLDSKFYNLYDTVYFVQGELLLDNDTMSVRNFSSTDTLLRRLSLLNKTLVEVRQYQADAWNINASYSLNGDTLFFLDAGKSTIRSLGDIVPPPMAPPGFCHIRTYGGELKYHNIEFGYPEMTGGIRSMLKSESKSEYNLVDYYYAFCDGVGTGIIDTLTWKPSSMGSRLRNNFWVNFVMAYGYGDTLMQSHVIDTAIFFEDGGLYGGHFIGYLQSNKFMGMQYVNNIDTAVLYGNAEILGENKFGQLVLSPNKRYSFQQENNTEYDTTFIFDDFVIIGNCDGPIRMQSDSIGTQAKILYKAQNPSNPGSTAINASIRDIRMVPYNSNQFIAENSVDLGNNTNWTFTESNNDVFYWVGGEGFWGDWQHWSFTSGGLPISERCVPKEINTVVFDNNSFITPNDWVVIDIPNAYCKNMYWTFDEDLFSPTFAGEDTTTLFVFGSMMLNAGMSYQYLGEVHFDQYNEPSNPPDTLYSRGQTFWNNVHFQGINDVVILDDDMTLYVDPGNQIYMSVFLEHGELRLNGKHMSTGGFFSVFKNTRKLDMTNSKATCLFDFSRAWWIDADNFTLLAANSTLINNSFMGTVITENGSNLKYHNVYLAGPVDSLYNRKNIVEYNIVDIQMESGLVAGNFIADTILINGANSGIFQKSTTNVIFMNGMNGSINNTHTVGRCYVNKFGFLRGRNTFDYCVFYDDGVFMGRNVFDTLILYPGSGGSENQGNWFYFQSDSTQIVLDSLYMRGNQCSNMTITSLNPPKLAFLQKDNGPADISCDFLNIYSVAAVSANLQFYAGENSTPLPNPNNPPPGWIFDNAQGYIPGFQGRTERFCQGEPYVIDATSFNGDPFTQYFWEGSQYPGNTNYTITEPGTYHIRVQYFEGCYVDDFINMELDFPPQATIAAGPFCEGDPIEVYVTPENQTYLYQWWNGETTSSIPAEVDYTGGIYVVVTDPDNNCHTAPNQTILVKPRPKPEVALGDDVNLKFGQSITMDAGEGDYYEWTSDPPVPIENPNERIITVPGYLEPIEYRAYVEIDGCDAEGFKVVYMYPPSKLGIPTAFSPNGDGKNDELKILGSGFDQIDFRIFDRYGQLVFETNDPNIAWDGTFKGKKQEMDVYTYYIKVVYLDKDVVEESGNITLLR